MFNKIAIITLCLLLTPAHVNAQAAQKISSHGKWTVFSFIENGKKVCYMSSRPITDVGDYNQRGEISAFITHWPSSDSKDVFSYIAGYTYKNGSDVSVSIDGKTHSLFTQGGMAWAPDVETDKKLINAIKKGSTMVVKGTSSRGTLTTDTYSLQGSTAAYDAISKLCR